MPRKPATRKLTLSCTQCGESFAALRRTHKYCSRSCLKAAWRPWQVEYQRKHPEKMADSGKRWYEENRERRLAAIREYRRSDKGKTVVRETYQRMRARHPEKLAARQAVLIALRKGDLTKQPCQQCGAAKTQAHHDDYSKPLDVRWLCQPCHVAHHKKEKARRAAEGNAMTEHNQVGVYIEEGRVAAINGERVAVVGADGEQP